jgi:adenylate cyclase
MAYETAEEEWRALLSGQHAGMLQLRRTFGRLPAAPRCAWCFAPFHGVGGFLLKPWFGPWQRNSQLCKNCFGTAKTYGVGGAEIELSMLFADIRGSTGLGEQMRPTEFSALLSSFYRLATKAVVSNLGVLDKFVGDEAIGLFIPAFSGPKHADAAIAAGLDLLRSVGRPEASAEGPIPVGAAVHTGVAFTGMVGSSIDISEFTALGDSMNTTARLAALAGPGELLVSVAAAERAGIPVGSLERRSVEVRGRDAGLDVYAIRPEHVREMPKTA